MKRMLRLRKRSDFNKVFRHGKSVANGQFVLHFRRVRTGVPFRFGISASKKVGNAVTRNRIRRRIKEIVRHFEGNIVSPTDIVCIVRKSAVPLEYAALERSVLHVLHRAKLLHPAKKQ